MSFKLHYYIQCTIVYTFMTCLIFKLINTRLIFDKYKQTEYKNNAR